jgi:HAD superfamily hydrolase (TIGR01509 family)
MIHALVFDFDGLIIDTETPLIDAHEEVHRRGGKPFSRALCHEAVGRAELHFDPWAAFGPEADRAALTAEMRGLNRMLVRRQPVLPGVINCLDAAQARGLQLAVASNSDHAHVDGHLVRLGLRERFACIHCVEDVRAGKPAPDLYLAVLAALGVAANEAVAFEDSEHGVLAAKRAGLRCVAVPGPSTASHDLSAADLVLPSLAHCPLPELLARFDA